MGRLPGLTAEHKPRDVLVVPKTYENLYNLPIEVFLIHRITGQLRLL